MEVFTKLNAFEDEVFVEMEKIEKQIDELKEKQTKLREIDGSIEKIMKVLILLFYQAVHINY